MKTDTIVRPVAHKAFWSGLDANSPEVKDCPGHVMVLIDVDPLITEPPFMRICKRCFSPACGTSMDPDPCIEPRHHRGNHRHQSGRRTIAGSVKMEEARSRM